MNVSALETEIQCTKERVDVLESTAAVDSAIAVVDRFLDALGEEIDGRETHHKRFFQVGECPRPSLGCWRGGFDVVEA